jgi:hypothetical protein
MLKIYYKNNVAVVIRPTPLVSISHSPIKNKIGTIGCTYSIVLTGTIIAHQGSPKFLQADATNPDSSLGFFSGLADEPNNYNPDIGDRLKAIIKKQNAIRNLFSEDGQKMELVSWKNQEKSIVFYPNVISIAFEEGIYIDTCKYTVTLEAPLLFDKDNNIYPEGLIGSTFSPNKFNLERSAEHYLRETLGVEKKPLASVLDRWGGIVEDFSDTWSIEADESNAQTFGSSNIPVSYIVSRNISATGRTFFFNNTKYEAWEQALGFVKKTLLEEPQASPVGGGYNYAHSYEQYPDFKNNNMYGFGTLNLPSFYRGYNHTRTINIDKTAGSCAVVDTWLLASGQSHLENFTIAVNTSLDNQLSNVKIDGNIKGLSDLHASGYLVSEFNNLNSPKIPYTKALTKYREISNNGLFGVGCDLYNRAKNAIQSFSGANSQNIVLNPQPLSVALGSNEINGEITYSIEFDNRPINYFTNVIAENISINDNYPGDLFAVIPVIGRQTGPILQYLKNRTEYRRDLNIELIVDINNIDITQRSSSLLKPSLNLPTSVELQALIRELSPLNEPNVVKYFLKPPAETWSPMDGRYNLTLSWEYEKSI